MPVAVSYPGVYVEEIPSGVRTITGVATSITAFIGGALRGPVNKAVTINNYGDFERVFGGLWVGSTMGFAVRDFYLNGGSQAIIVRLYHPSPDPAAQAVATATDGADANAAATAARTKAGTFDKDPEKSTADRIAKAAEDAAKVAGASVATVKQAAKTAADAIVRPSKAQLVAGNLNLEAAYEGGWGTNLRASVDLDVSADVAKRMGLATTDLFNLTVRDTAAGGVTERFLNVSLKDSPRRLDKVLDAESKLVRWSGTTVLDPNNPPAITKADDTVTQNEGQLTKEQQKLADLQKATPPDANAIKGQQDVVDKATKALADANAAMKSWDGSWLTTVDDFTPPNGQANKQGLYALEQVDLFNLLCLPPYQTGTSGLDVDSALIAATAAYCETRRAMLLVDAPSSWTDKGKAKSGIAAGVGTTSKNAALFFPRLREPNPLHDNQIEDFVPCGAVAGVFARTDTQRGVWKAPAGLDATLVGVPQVSVPLTDAENGELNPLGVNCLRAMPAAGRVIWGSRTLQGDDRLASEWKYIPIRRLALYIEESLYRGTQWVVFEPNDEPLWAQIRLNVGAFMHNLFRQGAFQGTTPRDAYFVKCDKETTAQNDINLGIVNIVVGFAPLKPAEFVVIKLQQMAGQIET